MHTESMPKRIAVCLLATVSSAALPSSAQQALFDGVTQGLPTPQGGSFTPDQNVIQWGPARVAIGMSYSLRYTDNVNLTPDRQWDLINTPLLNLGFYVPVADTSSVQFSLGVGYAFYVNESDLNRFILTPGSALTYTIPLDNWTITFYDSMSFTSDPLAEPGLSRTGQYGSFQNSIGTRVTWSPDRWVLTAGASYRTQFSTVSQYDYLNSHGPNFIVQAGYKITGQTQVGLETSVGLDRYDDPLRNDFNSYSMGPYLNWQLLENLNIVARTGYVYYDFARASVGAAGGTFGSYYGNITASQRLTDYISHSLTLSREFSPGISSTSSQLQQTSEITYSPQWQFTDAGTLSVSGGYQKGNNGTLGIGDSYNRWVAGAGVNFLLTSRWRTGLNYQFYSRDSSDPRRSYKVNNITWSVSYSF